MNLSEHFTVEEFECKCGCGFRFPSQKLIDNLELLRAALGDKPIIPKSGNRCPPHNKAEGGAPHSQHIRGAAADIYVPGMTPAEVMAVAETIGPVVGKPNEVDGFGGLGVGSTIIHVDVRPRKSDGTRARWTYGNTNYEWRKK